MRINHNIASMNAHGSLFKVNRDMNKSIAKLSSGLRINSAADDAAGLGVSENLRTQVRGMEQARKNTQDAIAMLNVADGALNEQADIMQRMRELVIQARNDTYSSEERSYIHAEFEALIAELDRIAAATQYNGMTLFAAPEHIMGSGTMYPTSNGDGEGTAHRTGDARNIWDDWDDGVFGGRDMASAHHFNMLVGANYTQVDSDAYNGSVRQSWDKDAENMITIQFGAMDANALLALRQGVAVADVSEVFDDFEWDPNPGGDTNDRRISRHYYGSDGQGSVQTKFEYLMNLIDGNEENIPDNGVFNYLRGTIDLQDGSTVQGQNITGIERINRMRADIGAMINRLEHNVNNLSNQIMNTQAAESIIRDADFASESVTLAKNQILSQSSTAMLAQANMAPQLVAQLIP